MIGIEERTNQLGIRIVRLHYTAEPEKRTPEWLAMAKQGMSERQWRQEMEIDWTVASGLPVYADIFEREFHVSKEPLLAYPDLPIYRGFDFGLTPACVWAQKDPQGRLNVLGCHVVWNGKGEMKQMGIERFTPEVVQLSNDWFPGATFKDYADPAGWQKAQTDEKTCVEIMRSHGVFPVAGPVTWTARKRAMTDILERQIGGRAAFVVSNDVNMIIEGLDGAYKYEEIGDTGRYKETVEKNAWSHPMNALEYVVGALYAPPQQERKPSKRRQGDRVTGY